MPRPLSNPQTGGAITYAVPYPAAAGTAGPTVSIANVMLVGLQSYAGPSPSPYSGAWLEINNDSDSALLCMFDAGSQPLAIVPGQARSMPVPMGATSLTTTIIYQNSIVYHQNQLLMVNFFTPTDLAAGHEPLQGSINPSTPAASIGPGTLPAGVLIPANQIIGSSALAGGSPDSHLFMDVAIGANPNLAPAAAQVIGTQLFGSIRSGVYGAGAVAFLSSTAQDQLLINNYNDGTNDRFIASANAYQLQFINSAGWRFRASTDITPTAGAVVTWGAFVLLVDTSGNRYADPGFIASGALAAGVTIAGSQVTGDLAVGQVGPGNLDTDVNLTGKIVSLGGVNSAGAFGAPLIVASTLNQNITVTTAVTILNPTLPAGLYRASGSFILSNGTLPQHIKFTYGAGTFTIFTSATAFASLDGATASISANGLWVSWPQVFALNSSSAVACVYQDPGGTPNDLVSLVIEQLA